MLISSGTRVRRYEVTAPLGAGGMGEVYLARDVELDRTVALKVLSDAPDDDGDRIRRFIQEARAAIALNHPNVAHVYDVGEENGVRFIAMEYVEGETLRARMSGEPLTLAESLELGVQIAAALGSAHAHGIIHRDIKPENVMIRPDGYVKVLDFGLAKLTAPPAGSETPTMVVHTAPGLVMGTMQYMSPEQLRTDDIDARSDVFSLGVVLYEMVTGRRPFEASSPSGVIASILTEDPPALDAALPPSVRAIIVKALSKKRDERYPTAREMAEALKQARDETKRIRSGDLPTEVVTQKVSGSRRLPWKWIAVAVAILAAIAIGSVYANRARAVREARAKLPQLEKLAEERNYFAAWDLADALHEDLGDDPVIARVRGSISVPLDVKSEPAGAQVFLERVSANGTTTARTLAGTTPLAKHPIALGDYVIRVEKEGFAPLARTIALSPIPLEWTWLPPRPVPLDLKLTPMKDVPKGMVRVAGGRYRIAAWSRPTNAAVTLDDFYIDQFEVTNREFAEFIRAGGYERRELWKHPFLEDGKTLTFDEAMLELKDASGMPAPRRWMDQNYPEGRDEYPVTDVSWYEAAAYAEFRGKRLPTIFEWDKAARDGSFSAFGLMYPWGVAPPGADIASRANFRGSGTMPVQSLPSGMSAYGAHHMAGNVAEWCLNQYGDGMMLTGGDFNSPTYSFGNFGSYPPMHSSSQIGFRCSRPAGGKGDQGGYAISRSDSVVKLDPVSDAEFTKIRRFYDYSPAPLNARIVEKREGESWTMQKIEFDGAQGRAFAHLYLPKNAKPPYQVIHFVPATDVAVGRRSLDAAMEAMLTPFLRGGRAVFGVVLRGYIGRPSGRVGFPAGASEEYADFMQEQTIDFRRGVDYLVTRPEIDRQRIAYFGPSAGAHLGIVMAALENRYRCVTFMGVGMPPDEARDTNPKANRKNFAPRMNAPKLMLHGRWDEVHPLQTEALPLYELMPEPKEIVIVDSGHIPPLDVVRQLITAYLDRQLGKVQR